MMGSALMFLFLVKEEADSFGFSGFLIDTHAQQYPSKKRLPLKGS